MWDRQWETYVLKREGKKKAFERCGWVLLCASQCLLIAAAPDKAQLQHPPKDAA